jgi:hypothetical protein
MTLYRYQAAPADPFQAACRHNWNARRRHVYPPECTVCGSVKRGGKWWYLTAPWLAFYLGQGPRPDG